MRDTQRLRRHLTLLAALPMALSSCDRDAEERVGEPAPPSVQGAAASPTPAADGTKLQNRGAARAAAQARKGPIINEAPEPAPLSPEEERFAPIPGDPPWIDGYNPEEAPCPSGNWCGTIETATAVAVNRDNMETHLDCPTRITGSHDPSPIEGAAYKGLSEKRAMQGSLNEHGTVLARAEGRADACCYHWFEYCSGRPFMSDQGAHRATARIAPGWLSAAATEARAPETVPGPADPSARAELAAAWLADALDEHASVASFARATLELMAVGAPAELLADTQRASLDEIEHARLCFALARRFGAAACAPGPLPALPPRGGGLAELVRDTFWEGCVGETIAALVAERAACRTSDPVARSALLTIARDEARHAALAWRTVAWALTRDRNPVQAVLARAGAEAASRAAETEPSPRSDAAIALQPWGRLSADELQRARSDAHRDIIAPMLARLLESA